MNDQHQVLRIGAGRGPRSARCFVGMLADALQSRLLEHGARVTDIERHGERHAPSRIALQVHGHALDRIPQLLGTHLLLGERGRRSRGRRRLFARVELDLVVPDCAIALSRSELNIQFMRSSGPGGQNVNKRETAVLITHRPTGLRARCDSERSQARNRATALEQLARAVAEHTIERTRRHQQIDTWQAQRDITTHEPVMCWRLDPKTPDLVVPADA